MAEGAGVHLRDSGERTFASPELEARALDSSGHHSILKRRMMKSEIGRSGEAGADDA